MKGQKADIVRLIHIRDAIGELQSYAVGNFADFIADSMKRFASIKQLEIIGEASKHVSEETKREFAEIPWADMMGLRNVLAHEYFQIDLETVWRTALNDIPLLKDKIENMINILQSGYE